MRKMKKINGFLVVRFNDREKRDNPTLGSFGVIDAEQYTGDLDYDLDAFEYTDADLIEIAVEQARGLNSEEDYSDEPPVYTVTVESAEEVSEKEVFPKSMTLSWAEQLKTQIKSKHYPDIDPRTAAHELAGYKTALYDLGLLDRDDEVTEPGIFAWNKGPGPEQEEALAYVCDELCKFREGRSQEELDAICAKCKVARWAGAPPTLTPGEVKNLRGLFRLADEVSEYVNGEKPPRETFQNVPSGIRNELSTKKVYALGLALAEECPDNDCRVYLNIFNAARELDEALDTTKPNSAPFLTLRSALVEYAGQLWQMYDKNYAVQQYREGMKA